MSTHPASRPALLALGLAVVLALVATPVTPAAAQEWKIYLFGKTQPIVADYYAELTPWIFYHYHDDQSMPRMPPFAIGCNVIERVERAGAAIPLPACPVDRLPTTMARIYFAITELEAKRLDDSIVRLREQTRAYAQALISTFAATGGAPRPVDADLIRQGGLDAASFLQSQIGDTLLDIRFNARRVGALMDAARSFPRPERSRYFFFSR